MTDGSPSVPKDLSALRLRRDDAPPRRRGRLVAVLALAAAAGAFLIWKTALRPDLPEVEVATVRLVGAGVTSAVLSASGYILPDRKADVTSKTFGRLEWIGVDVGSQVRQGDVLARLANADLAAKVEEAKAELADAEREHDRWKRVVESGVEPRERLDKATTALDLARARLKAAEAEYEYTLIRAPFDGVVVRRFAQVGETVGPAGGTGSVVGGGPVCAIVDRASLEMVADVNETNIAKIRESQPATVATDAHPDRVYRGEVRQIVPTADRQKGIVQVKVRILNPDERLLPEMAARATFLREGASDGGTRRILAPRASIRDRGGRRVTFVVEGNRVRAVPVETGDEGEDGIEIKSGLLGGEQVVIGGAIVEDGAKVRIKGRP